MVYHSSYELDTMLLLPACKYLPHRVVPCQPRNQEVIVALFVLIIVLALVLLGDVPDLVVLPRRALVSR